MESVGHSVKQSPQAVHSAVIVIAIRLHSSHQSTLVNRSPVVMAEYIDKIALFNQLFDSLPYSPPPGIFELLANKRYRS